MEQEPPLFSIIIPAYNRPRQLTTCLAALAHLDYPRSRFEVIVADDGSDAPLETVIAPFHDRLDVLLLRQPHAGPAAARNTGATRAKGDFLAYTGDDCTPAPDWLQTLAARLATAAPDYAVGGKILNALDDNPYATASCLLIDYLYSYYNAVPDHARFFTPNNLTLPRDCFSVMGGFDASFVRGAGEDREFCNRWLRHGYRMVYSPEVLVYHAHALTFRTFWRQHFSYGCGSLRYHLTYAQRDSGRIELEPFWFYLNLLRYPFSGSREKKRLRLIALLGVSQVANATGFFWESRRKNWKQ